MKSSAIFTTNPNMVNPESRPFLLRLGDRIPFFGIYLTILSGLFFTSCKLGTKLTPTIHPVMIVCIRSFFSAFVYLIVIKARGGHFWTNDRKTNAALLMRGLLGFCTCTLSFAALITVPLGDSITILLCYAVYANIFARLILKEPLTIWNGLFILITLTGVILIAHPPFLFAASSQVYDHGRVVGICLNIGASFSFALSLVVMRTLHGKHVSMTVFHFGLITGVGTSIVLIIMKQLMPENPTIRLPTEFWEIFTIVAIGIAGTLAEMFLTMALQVERTGVVAVTRGLDILMAYSAQLLFLKHETVMLTSAVGGLITLVGVCGNAFVKHQQDLKREQKKQLPIALTN